MTVMIKTKTQLQHLFLQNYVTHLWNFMVKNQEPWTFYSYNAPPPPPPLEFSLVLFSIGTLGLEQSCLFVQCWPGIFLVQCKENLCNVGMVFAAASHYQKINWPKIKIAVKWFCSDDIENNFFLCIVVLSLKDNTRQGFYLCNIVPRVY